jgi:hypothetical protein
MKTTPEIRAQLLEQALAQIESGQDTLESFLAKFPDEAAELRPELEAALWLRNHKPGLDARPGFMAASRAHLIETIRSSPPAQKQAGLFNRFSSTAPRNHLLEALSLMTLIVCIVFVAHNVMLMSELSLPGEFLYPIKLSLEQSRLAFTFDEEDDTRLQIQMSQRRTSEIVELILDKNYSAIPGAVDRLDRQLQASLAALKAIEESNPSASQALSKSYQESLSTESMILTILLDTYPPTASEYIESALRITNLGLAALQD